MEKKNQFGAKERETYLDMRGDIDFSKSRGVSAKENVNGL